MKVFGKIKIKSIFLKFKFIIISSSSSSSSSSASILNSSSSCISRFCFYF